VISDGICDCVCLCVEDKRSRSRSHGYENLYSRMAVVADVLLWPCDCLSF